MTSPSGSSGAPTAASRTSLLSRLAGIVTHPRRAFTDAASAGWLVPALVLALVGGLPHALLLRTTTGQLALADQWERARMAFGTNIDDAGYAALVAASEQYGSVYALGSALLRGPVLVAVLAVLIHLVGRPSRPWGATASVVAHSGVILALRDVVSAPVSYVRETMTAPGSLGLWFPVLDAASPMARLLGVLDAFVIWWLVVLAIGLGVLLRRPARRLFFVLTGLYIAGAAVLAGLMALADTGI